MQQYLRSIAAANPVQPLTPGELVTDETLRFLARGEPDWQRGVISEEFQSILVMVLPDLCGELIAYRAAACHEPALPFSTPRNHAEEIANARAALDGDQGERIEGLAQHACDELAGLTAQIAEMAERDSELAEGIKRFIGWIEHAQTLPKAQMTF